MTLADRGRWIRHTVTEEEAGRTVEEILVGTLEISRRMIQRLTRSSGILVNRRAPFLGRKVRTGDVVAVRVEAPEAPTLPPVPMELSIVHEDDDLLVLDKPAGILVHPTSPRDTRTLSHGLAHHFQRGGIEARVRPVHRLDRDTSGLLLVAKSAFAHQHLDRQLRSGEMEREYLAVVDGIVEQAVGRIEAPIGPAPSRHLRRVDPRGQSATTTYEVVERLASGTLISARLETGRTHQIRVHMAHIGHPLIGDTVYGAPRTRGFNRFALHSWRLRFRSPRGGEPLLMEAPLPPDLHALLNDLRA